MEAPDPSQAETPDSSPETPTPEDSAPEEEAPPPDVEAAPKGEQAADGEEKGPPAAEEKPEEKRHRAGGFQRKIERLEKQNQILMEQLQRSGQTPAAPAGAKDKTPADQAVDYIDNLVTKRVEALEAQRQGQARQSEFQKRTEAVRAVHPDFDEVVMGVDAPVSPAVSQVLLTSERGPEIMYQLAKNPAELARISALPPLDAAREIGRLEARASVAAPPQKPGSAIRPPVPPSKVGGSGSSTRNLDELPLSEYKRAYRSGRR